MIYIFVPYYNEDTPEFKKSLESQTVPYTLIRRDTKASKILWTEAVNDFWEGCFRWNWRDEDVIGIMCNDIEFREDLFEDASVLGEGEVVAPYNCLIEVNWKTKKIACGKDWNAFMGRCFFMTVKDFKESGGFCKLLPHTLSDVDFAVRMWDKNMAIFGSPSIIHKEHEYPKVSCFSKLSYKNPIAWTVFLLRHPNRYTLINILKAWYDIFRGKNNLVSTNRR